jgi:hypothetical protein
VPSAQLLYLLDVRTRSAVTDFLLNDIVVYSVRDATPTAAQVVVNAYVLQGRNQIVARTRPTRPLIPDVAYRLIKTFRAAGAPEEELAARRFPNADAPLPSEASSVEFTDEFQVVDAFGTWAWQGSGVRRFDEPRDAGAIIQVVRDVHDALARRDVDALLTSLQVKFTELARALQLAPSSLSDDAREHFSYLFATQEWALKPLAPEEIVLRPMAGGALVAPTRLGGRPLIESIAGPPYKLEMMVANIPSGLINPAWQVVR